MKPSRIEFEDDRQVYHPGDRVRGVIRLDAKEGGRKRKRPRKRRLMLGWETSGHGDVWVEILATKEIPEGKDNVPFDFKLPAAPYSCRGRHVSIQWFLELTERGKTVEKKVIVMGPEGMSLPVDLYDLERHIESPE